jgi:hypothetical protein
VTTQRGSLLPQLRTLIEQWRKEMRDDYGYAEAEANDPEGSLRAAERFQGRADTWKACAEALSLLIADHGEATTDATAHEKEEERSREGEVVQPIESGRATASSAGESIAGGFRFCVHGRTPLGSWCRQCNPLRR